MAIQNYNLIVVLGATASGKTRLGVELAKQLDGEIISADSRQVYTGLDIGTGKDLDEYGAIPHYLIDIIDPGLEYNACQFQHDFFTAFKAIQARDKTSLLVGGSGLYIDAVVSGYEFVQVKKNTVQRALFAQQPLAEVQQLLLNLDSELYQKTDVQVRPRLYRAIEIAQHYTQDSPESSANSVPALPAVLPVFFAIKWDRSVLRQRISLRLQQRFEQGMIAEVEGLLEQGMTHEKLDYLGLEYRFISQHLRGQISYDDMFSKLETAIHQYAKRQDTWFRRMERHGCQIHWLAGEQDIVNQAQQILTNYQKV